MRILICLTLIFTSCSVGEDIFDDLGTNISGPTGFFVDSVNRRLYVTNANSGVSYDWQQGSFQVFDITAPQSPTLLGTAATLSFSGEIHLDTTNQLAYVANRFSEGVGTTGDHLLVINTNEASPTFLSVQEVTAGLNPFAVACCASGTDLLLSTSQGVLQYAPVGTTTPSLANLDLLRELSSGFRITRATVTDVVILGSQAFLSRSEGGVYVVNLSELSSTTANAVDYFISDVRSPRGLATDGTNLVVTDEDTIDGTFTSRLLVLNISSLTALADNTTTTSVDKDDAGLVTASITVGRDPQEVVVAGTQAFVTNMSDDTVSVIDLTTQAVTTTITVGDQPFGMVIDAPGGTPTTLYVGNLNGNTISIIDIPSSSAVATYP